MTYKSVTESRQIWEEFQKCSEGLLTSCGLEESVIKKFVHIWTRKMVHARLGEFIKCYNIQQAAAVRKRVKGGQSLRDELFCVTKKAKQPARGKVGRVEAASSKKLNNNVAHKEQPLLGVCATIKKKKVIAKSKTTESTEGANNSTTSNTESTPTSRKKSRRLCKSKKFDIYCYE